MATRTPPVPAARRSPHDNAVHKDDAEDAKVSGHDARFKGGKEPPGPERKDIH